MQDNILEIYKRNYKIVTGRELKDDIFNSVKVTRKKSLKRWDAVISKYFNQPVRKKCRKNHNISYKWFMHMARWDGYGVQEIADYLGRERSGISQQSANSMRNKRSPIFDIDTQKSLERIM
jgi:hypothetical protein